MQHVLQVTQAIFIALGGIISFLTTVLFLQVAASFLPRRRTAPRQTARPRVAVLIPAHDEENDIVETITAVRAHLSGSDRILVVADNCTDQTAPLARANGAEVVERFDHDRRGKGFALELGRKHLSSDPPDVVVVIDADCRPRANAISWIASVAHENCRPVQAQYLMHRPVGFKRHAGVEISTLAWRIKCHTRPLGMRNLGLPCQLMGTGMAFPWSLLSTRNLATDEIVEDLALGLELARSGHPPMFAPEAEVYSHFPSGEDARAGQRQRWETGHLNLLWRMVPRRLPRAIAARDLPTVALLLDLSIPPLSFLALTIVTYVALATIFAAVAESTGPLALGSLSSLLLALSVLLGWLKSARNDVALGSLVNAPIYALSKAGLYAATLAGRRIGWIRTQRD